MKYCVLIFLIIYRPNATAVVDYTLYLQGVGFSLQFDNNKPMYRLRSDGATYLVKGPHHQKALLHMGSPERLYGELIYSILSHSIGLPNNAKYPTFVVGKDQYPHPVAISSTNQINRDLTLALYEPVATYIDDTGLRSDSKALSELIMHLSLLYLFGAESVPTSEKFRYPIRMTSGERDFRSRSTVRTDHYTLVYLPNLKTKHPTQLLASLAELQLSKSFFSSTTQKDTLSFLNTYTTYLESIPEEKIEELFKPLEAAIGKRLSLPFLERRRHLRSLLVEFFETLKFNKDFLNDFKIHIPLHEPAHILLPELYSNMNALSEVKDNPIRFLWNLFFSAKQTIRDGLIEDLEKNDSRLRLMDVIRLAQTHGENFYSVTPHLSQRSFILEHQTQLNQHRYQTFVVSPFNDMEAKLIHNLARKLGSHSLAFEVPHGYELTIADAVQIIKKAKDVRAKTILLVELPGKIPQVESLMKKEGFDVVIIDHHSHGLHNDRTHRLSSLEQFAHFFGYKLSAREYIAGVMDRSFVYGLNEVGLDRQEVLEILKSISQEDYYAIEKNLNLFLQARKIYHKLRDGSIAKIYLIENKYGKLAQVSQAAALLEFPDIANVLVINRGHYGESILFSGIRELSEKFKNEFSKWKTYQNQFSGGNQRNVGYWGIEIRAEKIKGQLSEVTKKIYELIGLHRRHNIHISTEDESKFAQRRDEILSDLYRTQIFNMCRDYFH